jgi:rhodanese-related sulfurtransferase
VIQQRSDETFVRIEPANARALIEHGIQVMDVREPHEYAALRLPGSAREGVQIRSAPTIVLEIGDALSLSRLHPCLCPKLLNDTLGAYRDAMMMVIHRYDRGHISVARSQIDCI